MNNLEKWSQFPGDNEKIYAKTMQKNSILSIDNSCTIYTKGDAEK